MSDRLTADLPVPLRLGHFTLRPGLGRFEGVQLLRGADRKNPLSLPGGALTTNQTAAWLLPVDTWMNLKGLAGCPPQTLWVWFMWTDVFAVNLITRERCYAAAAAAEARRDCVS